ncbi:MAG TPA: hotdog fold thioesterase [Candidatus Nanopelagicales bacterium]|nr:hotdog fold thioesterase [Candidatus Nanopelagicales bacterium]
MAPDAISEELAAFGMGALAEKMGIELLEASADRVVGTMPVAGNTQPYGLLHGGASAVLAESLGSVHAAVNAGPENVVVGLDLNCTHHRGLTEGTVTGEATTLSAGRTIVCSQIRITDEAGRPVCTARLTCLVRPATNR